MFTDEQIKKFLNMEYDQLKTYLLNSNLETKKELLMNNELKIKLINSPKRHDFIWLAQEMDNDLIPLLISGEGINILSETSELCDKLNGIITSRNSYVNELLKMDEFNKLIVENLEYLKHLLSSIDNDGAVSLMNYLIINNVSQDKILKVFCEISSSAQESVVNTLNLSKDLQLSFLNYASPLAASIILENNINTIDLSEFSFSELYSLSNKEIRIPNKLFDNKEFIKIISNIYDIKNYRMMISAFSENNDISIIEKYRKEYYDNQLLTFNFDEKMLDNFSLCYNSLIDLYNKGEYYSEDIKTIINEYFKNFNNSDIDYNFYADVIKYFNNDDMIGLKEHFQKQSNLELTNIIIDYHFQDVYFNVLIDINELLNFLRNGENFLSDEDVKLYHNIVNLDNLSFDEKLKIHNNLKSINMVEKFYDDIRTAKNKSYNMIKEEMLTKDKLTAYKNENFSDQAGVNIYVLDGEPFYAFVKSLTEKKDHVITELHSYVDAGSYSLDGSDKLSTYLDPQECYNILYGDFNIDQVIHTFPVDSYSRYIRGYKETATDRVNKIYTPKELISESPNYNEIVVKQKNEKLQDELNMSLSNSVPIAIYCYDKITPNDIESAKKIGIDIVVVNTRAYSPSRSSSQVHLMDTTSTSNEILKNNYLTSIHEDAMYGRKQ